MAATVVLNIDAGPPELNFFNVPRGDYRPQGLRITQVDPQFWIDNPDPTEEEVAAADRVNFDLTGYTVVAKVYDQKNSVDAVELLELDVEITDDTEGLITVNLQVPAETEFFQTTYWRCWVYEDADQPFTVAYGSLKCTGPGGAS